MPADIRLPATRRVAPRRAWVLAALLCPVVPILIAESALVAQSASPAAQRLQLAGARTTTAAVAAAPARAASWGADSSAPDREPAASPATDGDRLATGVVELTPLRRVELLVAPDGKAVAALEPGARIRPLARDRGWRRVQVIGWVREGDLAPADTASLARVSASDLRADPEGTRGQTVRWEVQILSFQLADALRRDLGPDEPYLLARGPGAENTLLYLAVPPSLVEAARAFPKASSAVITARVRNGRSEPVGVPILDLQTLARQ